MSIDPIHTNSFSRDNTVIKPFRETNETNTQPSESPSSTFHDNAQDELRLSSEQEEYDNLVNAIKQNSDIREEKVKKVKEALESGHYHISSEELADRIIQDTIIHSSRRLS